MEAAGAQNSTNILVDIKQTFQVYDFDELLHPLVRTCHALERPFRAFWNRADEIRAFPNEENCLTVYLLNGSTRSC